MVTISRPTDSSGEPITLLEAIARECSRMEEDCLYSAKGCFEAATNWNRVHLSIGIPTALVAAIAGVSAFNDYPLLAGSLAILVAALSSVSTFLNPSQKAQTFQSAGNRYNSLRARLRFLREVTSRTAISAEDQATQLKDVLADKETLSQESPIIPRSAFERARKGIEHGEARYAVDSSRPRAD